MKKEMYEVDREKGGWRGRQGSWSLVYFLLLVDAELAGAHVDEEKETTAASRNQQLSNIHVRCWKL